MAAKQQTGPLLNEVSAESNTNKEEWKQVASLKRRNGSPNENQVFKKRQLNLRDYWLANTIQPISTENSFELIKDVSEDVGEHNGPTTTSSATTSKAAKVPPIFVSGVQNIKPLQDTLDKIAKSKYLLRVLDNQEIKIISDNSEIYNLVIDELDKKKTLFYTYQKKEDKPYKAVLKNMHPSVDMNELKNEIESFGHTVVRITNVKHRITKEPLSIFFVELKANIEHNKKIYQITKLMNQIIRFEQPRRKREIPQCMRCQEYGHTKNYCRKTPACVKCAQNHLTSECPITVKVQEVKCANCNGNHVASYKGCPVRKQLQQKLFPSLRLKQLHVEPKTQTQSQKIQINKNTLKPNFTFAQAVNGQTSETQEKSKQTPVTHNSLNQIEQLDNNSQMVNMMCQLMNRMDIMLNLLTTLVSKL